MCLIVPEATACTFPTSSVNEIHLQSSVSCLSIVIRMLENKNRQIKFTCNYVMIFNIQRGGEMGVSLSKYTLLEKA